MSRNNFFLSSSSPPTNYSLVNRHIAQKEKAPRDRRLCSSQKPWDFFFFWLHWISCLHRSSPYLSTKQKRSGFPSWAQCSVQVCAYSVWHGQWLWSIGLALWMHKSKARDLEQQPRRNNGWRILRLTGISIRGPKTLSFLVSGTLGAWGQGCHHR